MSAYANSYSFSNMSRSGNDVSYQDQRTIQNTKHGNYMLTNYFASDCLMDQPIRFATLQPNVNYSGPHLASGGCNIDENSNLVIGSLQTHPRARLNLQQRSYLSVPFMGRGIVDVGLESRMQQGDAITNKKSITTLTEKDYQAYRNYPLIGSLQSDVTNPSRLIEESASQGWIRGGIPSRELTRDGGSNK